MSDRRSLNGLYEPPPPYTPSPEPQARPVQAQLPQYSPEQAYAPATHVPNPIPEPDQQPDPELLGTRSYYTQNSCFPPNDSLYTHSLDLPRPQDPNPSHPRAATISPVRHHQSSSGLRSKWKKLRAENEVRKSKRVYCTPAEAAAISGRNNAGYEWKGYVFQERQPRRDGGRRSDEGRRKRLGEDESVQRSREIAQDQVERVRRLRDDMRWVG